ncbi:transposase [Pelagicoccus sp. SDUM812005]|uniref:IS91 family transposase n=1 Tax=Pelagicoccus sp. SDUM812005 TaxID=3041257 RepID=UPI00280FF063|nr:transposase [Pelagicoccus sp. SDUM812005]MDQ8183882.1 transposase [Pelagicoccus sp. SDUM812005]
MRLSVADILARFHEACLERCGDSMRPEERKALQSILLCRTPAMGGRSYRCSHCERDHFAWHSCNHRICPRCGAAEAREWVAGRLRERLPVAHYMVTFTLPSQLRELCRCDAASFLKLFYACSSQAIKDVLGERRHLGGECGFVGFLQTWTQELELHPHIHYVVPAVALDAKGKVRFPRDPRWLASGNVFAARLKTLLLEAMKREGLVPSCGFDALWRKGWNCDVRNFGEGANALKYLGGYARRGPISDSRILEVRGGTVAMSVRNRDAGVLETRRIEGAEFVRRYLQHALPQGFHSVRYYGFLHPRAKAKLAAVREQLGARLAARSDEPETPESPVPMLCPRCRKPMEMVAKLSRAPPWERSIPKIWARRDRRAAA